MSRNEWLRREIGVWSAEGIVTIDTAETLLRRYQPTERRFSWGVMITGGFGALMIGLGTIALFAANWDSLGRPARAVISLAPVVLCGFAALVASAKGWKSMALWEPLGILWCIATAAGTCLVAQTYQVGGSVPGLVLFVALLMLPVWPIVATLVASSAAMVTGVGNDSSLYVVSLVLALGVLACGIYRLKLSYVNIGTVLLLWLIFAKFFASNLDFTAKGIVLILSGVAITVLNVVFIRLRKRRG